MKRAHVAALLAYVDKLDPGRAPATQEAVLERLDAWADVLLEVEPRAPHPEGHDWDASHAVRRHIARSPYPIKASDISRPWYAFQADVVRRHAGTFEPELHPEIDPDAEFGNAYVAALRAQLRAVASGEQPAVTSRAIGPAALATETPQQAYQREELVRRMKAGHRAGREENARRLALVSAHPDLLAAMHRLPGQRMWRGSVGGNRHVAAIVAEAEARTTIREEQHA
ncbi:cell surface glycoprotein [Streptomyces cyaneofuscatus]|uniref:cell surface glycoprotein n=1 Tax=Streptomyces cyaneofuscatus TaxID=66883 RepID=UPI00386F5ED5|nr:cell surface glycoprotein [Streptomyces cyaneofuscatus]